MYFIVNDAVSLKYTGPQRYNTWPQLRCILFAEQAAKLKASSFNISTLAARATKWLNEFALSFITKVTTVRLRSTLVPSARVTIESHGRRLRDPAATLCPGHGWCIQGSHAHFAWVSHGCSSQLHRSSSHSQGSRSWCWYIPVYMPQHT